VGERSVVAARRRASASASAVRPPTNYPARAGAKAKVWLRGRLIPLEPRSAGLGSVGTVRTVKRRSDIALSFRRPAECELLFRLCHSRPQLHLRKHLHTFKKGKVPLSLTDTTARRCN